MWDDEDEEDGFDMFGLGNAVEFAADDTDEEDSEEDAEAGDEADDSGVGAAVGSLLAGALGGVLGGAVGGMLANRRAASPGTYPPQQLPYGSGSHQRHTSAQATQPQQKPPYAPEPPQDQKSTEAEHKPYELEATGKRLHVYEFDGTTNSYTQFKVKDKPMIIYELDQSTGDLRPVGLVS